MLLQLRAEGQFESLKVIEATKTIRVPKPLAVIEDSRQGCALLVMEFLDLKSAHPTAFELGKNLAQLHLYNIEKGKRGDKDYVSQFGFHMETCCGTISQGNKWNHSWPVNQFKK